jgi:hypothetical protein
MLNIQLGFDKGFMQAVWVECEHYKVVHTTYGCQSSVQFSSSKISLNLELDFRFSPGNLLNFELDHQFGFRRVQFYVQEGLNPEPNFLYQNYLKLL